MLYHEFPDTPNARVPRMFAAEKDIELPRRFVDLYGEENRKPPYNEEINRTGQVPALQLDDGFVLREILVICEYLEELVPHPPLIGSTPLERAETRMWTRWIDLNYAQRISDALAFGINLSRDRIEKRGEAMLPKEASPALFAIANEKLAWLDREMGNRPFVCGDRFTLADIHLHVFTSYPEKWGFPPPDNLPWLAGHRERVGARPSAAA